jgi:adenylate cyclase
MPPLQSPASARCSTGDAARDRSAAARRLSIVVLPFANLSNDPEQQYFTDGITEDLR